MNSPRMASKTSLAFLMLTACAAWLGCSGESPAGDDTSPYAFRDNVVAEKPAIPNEVDELTVDWTGVPAFVAGNETHAAHVITTLGVMLSGLGVNGVALDPAKTPAEVAASIASIAGSKMCPGGTITYKAGDAFMSIDFGTSCTLPESAIAVSGTLLLATTTGVSGKAWAAGDLTIDRLSLDGYAISGWATVATSSDGDTVIARLALKDRGIVTFRGTSKIEDDKVTIEGSGDWAGPKNKTKVSADGWSCTSSTHSGLDFKKVERTTSACYAQGGRLDVTTAYECVRDTDAPGRKTLLSNTTMTFLPTTPTTRSVTGTVTASGGTGARPTTTMTSPVTERDCHASVSL